jgi:hypothetical protein
VKENESEEECQKEYWQCRIGENIVGQWINWHGGGMTKKYRASKKPESEALWNL